MLPIDKYNKNIDHHLYIDKDKKTNKTKGYIFFSYQEKGKGGDNQIYMAELEDDFITIKYNTIKFVLRAELDYETKSWHVAEGPFVIKKRIFII